MALTVERKLLRWGNGFGLRVTEDEARRLGLKAGDRVRAKVEDANPTNDVAKLALFRFGGRYDVRKILDEETA
jgi:antitoxin component of MazEF toxin-antitoxin module